jgi:GR25 family glycosyltransferase involved in LPS biosynthesis
MRIVVINMDRDVERWTSMRAHLVDIGVRGEDVRRFSAVDGKKLDRDDPRVSAACRAFCTPTMKGCALSHMTLWKTALENNDGESMLVLEDDARLARDWRSALDRAMAQIGKNREWDLILLGTIVPVVVERRDVVGPDVVRPAAFAGAHAYVISREGMKHYVETIERAAYHIDAHMNVVRRPDRVYLIVPQVATQSDMGGGSTQFVGGATAWPAPLNAALSTFGNGANYWMTVPFAQIPTNCEDGGGIAINAWTVAFVILGAVARRFPATTISAVGILAAAHVAANPFSPEMALCIVLFLAIALI